MGGMEDYKYLFKVGTSLAKYESYFLISIINACALLVGEMNTFFTYVATILLQT